MNKKILSLGLICVIALSSCYPGASYKLEYAKDQIDDTEEWIAEYKKDTLEEIMSIVSIDPDLLKIGLGEKYIYVHHKDDENLKAWVFSISDPLTSAKISATINETEEKYLSGYHGVFI